jgi:RNA polymerase sigma-70 factor, ECF subfamily
MRNPRAQRPGHLIEAILNPRERFRMETKSLPERTLVAKAQTGNEEAFTELVRRHSRQIYGLSLNMLRNREDAEDNLQNVLVKAFHNINRFEGNSQFSTWLVRISINEALMKIRKRSSERISDYHPANASEDEPRSFPEIEDSRQDPEREYISKELTRKVFRGLNPSLQDTFILQKAEGWTNRELAEAQGITVSTVKSRVFRARVRLRQQLMALIHPEQVALQG